MKFPGFLALYREAREEGEGKALEDEQALPVVEKGEHVPMTELTPSQHFTEPPPRFSEASLVKELEKLGIGRRRRTHRSSPRSRTGATSTWSSAASSRPSSARASRR